MTLNPLNLLRQSITRRLMVLTILPLVAITLVLTFHIIRSEHREIEQSLQMSGRSTADYLATISDFALYSGNRDLLASLASSAHRITGLHGVAFLDPERHPLATSPGFSDIPQHPERQEYQSADGRYLYFERPVFLAGLDVSDYAEERNTSAPTEMIGLVLVAMDRSISIARGRELLRENLGIGFAILIITGLLSWYLGITVVRPLTRLTRAVREMQKGDLSTRVEATTRDELADLARGINHLAASVAASRNSLEKQVDFATVKLQSTLNDLRKKNELLDRARQEAEAGNKAKGDFLAQMSHELRTPITAIQGFIRLLSESDLSTNDKRYCAIIDQAARQLLQLIDDILAITRLQSGNVELESRPMDLADCIENPVSLMAPSAHAKGLELILDISPEVPLALEGDSLRIRQIVFNLISNAIKFTDEGYVLVRVLRHSSSRSDARITIQVQDTGIGIADNVRQQVFDAFTQADNSISRRFGGTGLGLAIVNNLVSLMGGKIALNSTVGRGSCFTVTLPLARGSVTEETAPQPSCSGNILLYDPNPLSREALEHLLSRQVDHIISCESFDDLAITPDEMTPDMVIYSNPVTQPSANAQLHLQRLRDLTPVPILVLTRLEEGGMSLVTDLRQSLEPISFIGKPPTLAELKFALTGRLASATDTMSARTLDRLSILIAEDNDFNGLLLETLLSQSGARCDLVKNGREAIVHVNRESYDIILLDVHMPEMNGVEVVREIRNSECINRDTPVIMLTADVLKQEEEEIFRSGANELVFKPLNEARLLKTIQQLTGGAEITAAPGARPSAMLSRELFCKEIRKLTIAAADALAAGQEEALRDNVHQLLGIAGLFKMADLERAVRQVHICIQKQDPEVVRAAMESLDMEVSTLMAAESVGNLH